MKGILRLLAGAGVGFPGAARFVLDASLKEAEDIVSRSRWGKRALRLTATFPVNLREADRILSLGVTDDEADALVTLAVASGRDPLKLWDLITKLDDIK